MGVSALLTQAVVAALRAMPERGDAAVFDAPPVRASLPFLEMLPPILSDAGTKDRRGYEVRLTVRAEDAGERAARLGAMADAVAIAVAGMENPAGWELGAIAMTRSRMLKRGDGRWSASVEFRLRLFERTSDPADARHAGAPAEAGA